MTYGGDRPVTLQVPPDYVKGQQYPLVLILHGYGANGFVQQAYFGMNHLPGAFVLAPDGNVDSTGHEFWNADPACCDFDHTNPDDSGYLAGLLDSVIADWPIDRGAVFVIGHSNGGYMAYRMACDHADTVTNIVVLAGLAASAPTTCVPAAPVPVLHIHGTADAEVPYSGAMPSVTQWAAHDGCASTLTSGTNIDLDTGIPGAETTTASVDGCPPKVWIDLWSIQGGSHIPALDQNTFGGMIMTYLAAHRRL